MKKWIAALLMAGILAGLPGGCAAVSDAPDAPEDAETSETPEDGAVGETLRKAERVEIYDGDFQPVRTLSTEDELKAFFDALEADGWEWCDESPEETSPAEASFVFTQRKTETVLGGKPDEDDRQELIRLTIYENTDIAWVKMLLFRFHVKLPGEVLETLRTAAQR